MASIPQVAAFRLPHEGLKCAMGLDLCREKGQGWMWGDGGGEQEQERLCEASGQPPELLDPGAHVAAGLGWMGECVGPQEAPA